MAQAAETRTVRKSEKRSRKESPLISRNQEGEPKDSPRGLLEG